MNPGRELRNYSRQAVSARAHVWWEDRRQGRLESRGRCLNISEHGAGLQVSDSVPQHTMVIVSAPEIGLRGYGTVRHCHWSGGGYRVGIEFNDHVSFRLPAAQRVV